MARVVTRLTTLLVTTSLATVACQCQHAACFEGGNSSVQRLELHAACGERLWAITVDAPSAYLKNVDYGIVPDGYAQTFPATGDPRPLKPGEDVILLWSTSSSFTRHQGQAETEAIVRYGYWEGGPLQGSEDSTFQPGGDNEASDPWRTPGPECGA
jgi:hypothetical protein